MVQHTKSFRIAPIGHWQVRSFTDRFGSFEAEVLYLFLLVQGGNNVLLPTRCVDESYGKPRTILKKLSFLQLRSIPVTVVISPRNVKPDCGLKSWYDGVVFTDVCTKNLCSSMFVRHLCPSLKTTGRGSASP